MAAVAGRDLQGGCDPRFPLVAEALQDSLNTGEELGAAIAVDLDGELVVDVWGGHRDEARTELWKHDTLVNIWSATKLVTALAVLVLVERRELDLDAPVARYWPDFAAAGKQDVLVRQVMGHTSGVSGWEQPVRLRDMYDLEASTARLAAQAPWWAPGTASGYHAATQGPLLGELVRRTSGLSLTRFVAEELAGPLGVDVQIGAAEADAVRIAPVVAPPPLDVDPRTLDLASVQVRTVLGPLLSADAANSPAWRGAELGALNGHATARGLARLLSVLSLGGQASGLRLLSPAVVERTLEVQADGTDLVLQVPLRWGMGFGLPQPQTFPYLPTGRLLVWGGWGGSLVVMDLERRMTVAYVMNRMGAGTIGSPRSAAYLRAAYVSLGGVLEVYEAQERPTS